MKRIRVTYQEQHKNHWYASHNGRTVTVCLTNINGIPTYCAYDGGHVYPIDERDKTFKGIKEKVREYFIKINLENQN